MTSTLVVNDRGQQSLAGAVAAGDDDNVSHEYITMSDLLQDMGDDDGGRDANPVDTLLPKDAMLLEEVANHLDYDDILFGNLKWLENFREMK
jgi:hypothetical protein